MRIAKACKQCRESKRKCNSGAKEGPCEGCVRKSQSCSLARAPHQVPTAAPRSIAPFADKNDFPLDLQVCLVDIYLEMVHGKPHTLFHQKELQRAIREGRVPAHVLFAIAGLACRFSNAHISNAKEHYKESAKAAMKECIDDFCLDTIRACILVGNLYGAEGDSSIESLCFGLAFRIAHIIKLPEPGVEDDSIVKEEKIRVWWSLYMIDRWSSAGLNFPRQLPDEGLSQFPMHELEFYTMNRSHIGSARPWKIGLWAQMVRLARTFGRIQDLHRDHAAGRLDQNQIEMTTDALSKDLDLYSQELPPEHVLSEENLRKHAAEGLGKDFVALHLGLHHYSTLLYFPYLDLQLEGSGIQKLYAMRCKESAAALSDLLVMAKSVEGCDAVYFIVAHMASVSSAALLHNLLFGEEQTLSITRHRLEANFQTLVELQNLWPAAGIATHRLFTFQNMCLASADPHTHKADRWMVKYLLQHSIRIDERNMLVNLDSEHQASYISRNHYANDALAVFKNPYA